MIHHLIFDPTPALPVALIMSFTIEASDQNSSQQLVVFILLCCGTAPQSFLDLHVLDTSAGYIQLFCNLVLSEKTSQLVLGNVPLAGIITEAMLCSSYVLTGGIPHPFVLLQMMSTPSDHFTTVVPSRLPHCETFPSSFVKYFVRRYFWDYGNTSFLIKFSSNLFVYVSMDSYFIQWIIILYCHYWFGYWDSL